jgi:hypothetical protein
MYEDFLTKVQIFKSLDHYEISQIADALQKIEYDAGSFIFKEGELSN